MRLYLLCNQARLALQRTDVYAHEPVPSDAIIRQTPNLLMTPHIGYVTEQTMEIFYTEMCENMKATSKDSLCGLWKGSSAIYDVQIMHLIALQSARYDFHTVSRKVWSQFMSNYMTKYPRVSDLEKQAIKRLPPFVGAYLLGTGQNQARDDSVNDYNKVRLMPRQLRGRVPTDLATDFLGTRFSVPFSVAPVGLSSLIWPGSE